MPLQILIHFVNVEPRPTNITLGSPLDRTFSARGRGFFFFLIAATRAASSSRAPAKPRYSHHVRKPDE